MPSGFEGALKWIAGQRYLAVFVTIVGVLFAISVVQGAPQVPVLLILMLLGIAYGPLRLGSGPVWVKVLFFMLLGLRIAGLWIRSPD